MLCNGIGFFMPFVPCSTAKGMVITMFNSFFNFVGFADDNNIRSVDAFLIKYDGFTFLNGLYRIHNAEDIAKWNEILKKSFPKFQNDIQVFGYDWLGRNFALDTKRDVVLIFEPGTGEILNTQKNFVNFHNNEIPQYHNACLASDFFDKWFKANNHFILPHNKCAGYKVPLFLNGEDDIKNLEVSDMEVYWEIMMPLMNM